MKDKACDTYPTRQNKHLTLSKKKGHPLINFSVSFECSPRHVSVAKRMNGRAARSAEDGIEVVQENDGKEEAPNQQYPYYLRRRSSGRGIR